MTEIEAVDQLGRASLQNASENWKAAWNDIRGQFNHPDHCNRMRSSLLQEHAAIHGKKSMPSLGARYVNSETQHMFIFADVACVIYKKLDEHRIAQKNDTERCKKLFQSDLFKNLPTLINGMVPSHDFLSYTGIYMVHPNENGVGNSWAIDITKTIASVDAEQVNFISFIDAEESIKPQIKTPKFTPINVPSTREASVEGTDPGDGPAA